MPLTKKKNKRRSTSTPTPKTKVTPSKNEKKTTTSAPSSKEQQHVESVVKVEQNVLKAKKAWTDDIDHGKIDSNVALIIYSLRDNLDTFSFILVNGLFILFAFIIIVIMLNMLIAIMGDTYENVTSNYKMEGMLSRAQVVVDLLEQYASKKDPILNPRWLVMLSPLDAELDDRHWHGQLIELKKTVSKEVGALRGDVDKKLNRILELMEKQQMLGAHQPCSSSGGRKR